MINKLLCLVRRVYPSYHHEGPTKSHTIPRDRIGPPSHFSRLPLQMHHVGTRVDLLFVQFIFVQRLFVQRFSSKPNLIRLDNLIGRKRLGRKGVGRKLGARGMSNQLLGDSTPYAPGYGNTDFVETNVK